MNLEDRLRHLSPTKQILLREKLRQVETSSPRGQAKLVAFVTAKDTLDESLLQDILRSKLPQYRLSSLIVRLDQFPHTPNGKLGRVMNFV